MIAGGSAGSVEPTLVARSRFVSDAFYNGRWFRVLAVIDDFNRECITLLIDTSLSGVWVDANSIGSLNFVVSPAMIVSDLGMELTSHAILRWHEAQGAR